MEKLVAQRKWRFLKDRHAEPKNELPSMTVPDETMTIKQMLEKHLKGYDLSRHSRQGTFADQVDHDSMDLEKVRGMDMTEVDELLEAQKSRNTSLTSDLKKLSEKQKKKKEEKEKVAAEPPASPANPGEVTTKAKPAGGPSGEPDI